MAPDVQKCSCHLWRCSSHLVLIVYSAAAQPPLHDDCAEGMGSQVRRVEDELTLGDIVTVRVLGRNDRGQIRLTRKDVGLPLAARAA